jgi:hypothetical protein
MSKVEMSFSASANSTQSFVPAEAGTCPAQNRLPEPKLPAPARGDGAQRVDYSTNEVSFKSLYLLSPTTWRDRRQSPEKLHALHVVGGNPFCSYGQVGQVLILR